MFKRLKISPMKPQVIKGMADWIQLSDKKAVTSADFYQQRQNISALDNRYTQDEVCYTADNPFSAEVLQHTEQYLLKNNTKAFLIWHKGKLVHQKYYDFSAEGQFNSMSLVKSLLAICIGIAIDKRLIISKDEPAWHYLPEWRNDARQYISIDHLLTMQSGLLSDVSIQPKNFLPILALQFGNDVNATALSLPAVAPPEKKFVYNSYNSQLLGIILQRATGMTFADFVQKYVWQPMGLADAFVSVDVKGANKTFAEFFARPMDWLKLGTLILNKGRYQDTEIVSEQWIESMITPTNTTHRGVKDAHADYGRHIWVEAHHYGKVAGIPKIEGMYAKQRHADESMVYFEGMRGQYVFISPKHDLIVMRMGERIKRSWDASKVINQLVNELK